MPIKKQVSLALCKLATSDGLQSLTELYGVSKSTASKFVWKFVHNFVQKARRQLQWPQGLMLTEWSIYLNSIEGCQIVVGALDCIHVYFELTTWEINMDWLDQNGRHNMTSVTVYVNVIHDFWKPKELPKVTFTWHCVSFSSHFIMFILNMLISNVICIYCFPIKHSITLSSKASNTSFEYPQYYLNKKEKTCTLSTRNITSTRKEKLAKQGWWMDN
jgi:hypothetical protein